MSYLFPREWPQLHELRHTQARNGGPIAVMMKQDAQRWNDCKNKIFVFDAYGKLFKIIDVSHESAS